MRRRFERDALPAGKEPGNPEGCQLGRIKSGQRFCGKPMATTIGNVRICARHLKLLEDIRRHPDPEASAVRHPIANPFLRIAP